MSFKSILSDIGTGLKKFFTVANKVVTVADKIAQEAEPVVDIATAAFPGVGALYNTTVDLVGKAEGLAAAAGVQNGTGTQKLALVVAQLTPLFEQWAAQNGINVNPTVITNYINAVVATLNAIPAPNPVTSASTSTTSIAS